MQLRNFAVVVTRNTRAVDQDLDRYRRMVQAVAVTASAEVQVKISETAHQLVNMLEFGETTPASVERILNIIFFEGVKNCFRLMQEAQANNSLDFFLSKKNPSEDDIDAAISYLIEAKKAVNN